MKKSLMRVLTVLSVLLFSSIIALGSGGITAYANVPAEAENEGAKTTTPSDPNADRNGTARGNGSGDPLTPDGNGTEVDSVDDNGKYFYTFVTDAGNYFYIVVDESREDKNVYVLSTVNEEELLTLCDKGENEASDSTNVVSDASKDAADLFGTPSGTNAPDGGGDGTDPNTRGENTDEDGILNPYGAGENQTKGDLKGNEENVRNSLVEKTKDNSNLLVILVIIGVIGVGYYFKVYKPKHGSIGSGSSMDFEDDPDYEDEDEDDDDNIYNFQQERSKSMKKAREPEPTEENDADDNSEDEENLTEDSKEKPLDYEEKRALAEKQAEELKRQLSELHNNADQKISQQNEVIKKLEEENSSLKDTVSTTKSILTGSVVPDDEEEDEEFEDDQIYEERASPDI